MTRSPKAIRNGLVVLQRRGDFISTFRSGRRIRPADWMIFNFSVHSPSEDSKQTPPGFRVGWTIPKAVGIAVVRNRLKRWTRDWMRKTLKESDVVPPVDLNIGFRAMPAGFFIRELKRAEFDQAMERGWKRLLAVTLEKPPGDSSRTAAGGRK